MPDDPLTIKDVDSVVVAAKALLAKLSYDDSGFMGKGGNGGLISRETLRAGDDMRVVLYRLEKKLEKVKSNG